MRRATWFTLVPLLALAVASQGFAGPRQAPTVTKPAPQQTVKPQVKAKQGWFGSMKARLGMTRTSTEANKPVEPPPNRSSSLSASLFKKPERVYQLRGGQNVDGAIDSMIHAANAEGRPIVTDFNGTRLVANPGDSPETVKAPFTRSIEQQRVQNQIKRQEATKVRNQKLASFTKPLVRTPPKGMKLDPKATWTLDGGAGSIHLITPEQLKQVPEGTVLTGISGKEAIVGIDQIGGDTRGGYLAYGFAAH